MSETTERWLPIPGYEGYYEVSDLGRVRSLDRWTTDRLGRRRFRRAQVLTPNFNSYTGRYYVNLCRDAVPRTRPIYRLVIEAFRGPRPDGMEACHSDGDCTNDRLSNLRWDTVSENRRDTVRHGNHVQANKTHCPHGHALVRPNLVPSHPGRLCLACNRARSTVKRAAERGDLIGYREASDDHYARIMLATTGGSP